METTMQRQVWQVRRVRKTACAGAVGAVAAVATLFASQAWAVRVDGAPTPIVNAPVAASGAASGKSGSQRMDVQKDETNSMRTGVITAVADKPSRIMVNGSWLEIVTGETRVLRGGVATSPDSLKVGESINFLTAKGSPERTVVRVIYSR